MLEQLKNLSRHSVIYGLGSVLNRLLAFILLPIYTRYLTPADYGIFTLLVITGSVAAIISQLGLGSALFREVIYHESEDKGAISTALYFLVGEAVVVFSLLILVSPQLSSLIFGSLVYTHLLRLTFFTGVLQVLEILFLARLRIREQSTLYSAVSVARFLIGAGLNIYFIVVLRLGIAGLVMAKLILSGVFALVYFVVLMPDLRFVFSTDMLRRMLAFGAPMVPAGLAELVMVSANRYFLQHYSTTEEVGLYSLGYTIGMVMSLVVGSIQLAWPAQMFTIAKQPDAKRQFGRILTYYVMVLGFIGLSVSVLAHEILVVMTTPDFYRAATVVPFIIIAYIFFGIRNMTNTGLAIRNKMKYVPPIVITAAALNIGLNFVLIPQHGMLGAAWATVVSYLFLVTVNTAVNLRFWHVPYEYPRLLKVAAAWAIVYGLSLAIPIGNLWVSGGLKIALLVCFPVVLFLLRFFKESELDVLKGWLHIDLKKA
ncbi:MAG: oligosaccharide flippase family protein [Fidelibacterota bacterium]|nr:MAG: oligosaccharide flippase family protein [Candidatus Neomarinimicrobiota bacterium]